MLCNRLTTRKKRFKSSKGLPMD